MQDGQKGGSRVFRVQDRVPIDRAVQERCGIHLGFQVELEILFQTLSAGTPHFLLKRRILDVPPVGNPHLLDNPIFSQLDKDRNTWFVSIEGRSYRKGIYRS
jgi:hypothetical protein